MHRGSWLELRRGTDLSRPGNPDGELRPRSKGDGERAKAPTSDSPGQQASAEERRRSRIPVVRIAVLLRPSPAFPFNLLNYGLGLT